MTYAEALAFWYGRINYEVKAAGPGDLKLEKMRALLRLVGDPQDAFRSVHITGTKGKGSTAAMLASVLRAAGYRVGLFTSPHLVNVEERVQIDGVPITHDELAARMAELAEACRHLAEGPTFFELGTALGFLHFAYRRVDVAVVEVGLGGRFDSTNVLHPLVSVITSVGLDHVAQLGDTTAAIAFQKAGSSSNAYPWSVASRTRPHGRSWKPWPASIGPHSPRWAGIFTSNAGAPAGLCVEGGVVRAIRIEPVGPAPGTQREPGLRNPSPTPRGRTVDSRFGRRTRPREHCLARPGGSRFAEPDRRPRHGPQRAVRSRPRRND